MYIKRDELIRNGPLSNKNIIYFRTYKKHHFETTKPIKRHYPRVPPSPFFTIPAAKMKHFPVMTRFHGAIYLGSVRRIKAHFYFAIFPPRPPFYFSADFIKRSSVLQFFHRRRQTAGHKLGLQTAHPWSDPGDVQTSPDKFRTIIFWVHRSGVRDWNRERSLISCTSVSM